MHTSAEEYLASIDINEILYVNRIPLDLIVPKALKIFNPFTLQYKEYWYNEMRKCIDGFWVEHNGEHKYVPGILYFYGTHWHILLNKKGSKSKAKTKGSPYVRDLEWIKSFLLMTARGFSGFEEDDEYTCHREVPLTEDERSGLPIPQSCYNKKGELKKYIDATEYLRAYHKKPMGKAMFDNQALNIIDLESRGCLATGTRVRMFDGSTKAAEDIQVGDKLMGKDSTPRTVQWLHSGNTDMYDISSNRFDTIRVNKNHILSVEYKYKPKGLGKYVNEQRSYPVEELYAKRNQTSFRDRFRRYMPGPVFYRESSSEFNPYMVGYWLADGRSNTVSIKSIDKSILQNLDIGVREVDVTDAYGTYQKSYELKWLKKDNPEIYEHFREMLYNKHIPQKYKTASIQQRKELLAGIIDGDGCYDKKCNSIDVYCGTSEILADDTLEVARSLGLYANKTKRCRERCKDTYEVLISGGIHILPMKYSRKKPIVLNRRIKVTNDSFEITPVGKGDFYGFHLDGDQEYLLADYTVDHNTGKSYFMAAITGHNFLFDGAQDYDEWMKNKEEGTPLVSETMVGAGDSKYSSDTLSKTKYGLSNLKGEYKLGKKVFPAPMSKPTSGTWDVGKTIMDRKKKKEGGQWKTIEGSKLQHRSFMDNPFAANGTRGGINIIDEVGFMGNLLAALVQLKECTANSAEKFGVIWMCVCEGTKVWTASGNLVPIETLEKRDGIVGWDNGKAVPTSIKTMFPPTDKECVRITTNKGTVLECSNDHPILWTRNAWDKYAEDKEASLIHGKRTRIKLGRRKAWKDAGEIKQGEQILVAEEVPIFGNTEVWEPRLLGMLIGDGSYGFDKTPVLSNCDKDLNDYIDSRFDTVIESRYKTKDGRDYRETRIKGITKNLRVEGIYGQTKGNKTLPRGIHTASRDSVCQLIAGLYDTDGCIHAGTKTQINLDTAYKSLLEEVRLLLRKLGIHGSIQFCKPNLDNPIDRNGWYRLTINDEKSKLEFANSIPLLVQYKIDRLEEIKNRVDLSKFRRAQGLDGLRVESVVSVERIGIKKVYNLEADGHHTYMANGVVTHNTGTGGDMEGGSTLAAQSVFYSPESYECVEFKDCYENSLKSIGFFIPAWMGLNQFKDDLGNTDAYAACKYLFKVRKKLIKSNDRSALNGELCQRPIVPSEVFLIAGGNVFPVGLLKEQLTFLQTTNDPKYEGTKGVVSMNPDSQVLFRPVLDSSVEPCDFPVQKGQQKEGCVVIWEEPIEGVEYGLYAGGCLTPGEKVKTSEGLKNVEDVKADDKLVNRDGDIVGINTLLRHDKIDENTYSVKLGNITRRTNFTKEHPLLLSVTGYNKDKTIDEDKFDFDFVKAKDAEVGMWTKYPNQYRKDKPYTLPSFVEDESLFWWFCGLWLGDGWAGSDKIHFATNIAEQCYRDTLKKCVTSLERNLWERTRGNCVESTLCHKELASFLKSTFGQRAGGKYISEWVKYIPKKHKHDLLQGYLASDGCITQHTKGYYSTEFVSVSQALLEDFQDILFSLGVVSNNSLLRKKKKTKFGGKDSVQQDTWHLRLGHHATLDLVDGMTIGDDVKISRIDMENLPVLRKRPKDGCFISECGNYIYLQIKDIDAGKYTGVVYNFDCETHTFLCPYITTHNCDPYDHDSAETISLGSMFIIKRTTLGVSTHDQIVAEYTGRPEMAKEFYENCRMLCEYYGLVGTMLYENEKVGIKTHLENRFSLHILAQTPSVLKANAESKVDRKYGQHMSQKVKKEVEKMTKDWLLEPAGDGKLNLHYIFSVPLLKELINYDSKNGNFDRVIALMLGVLQLTQMYNVKAEAEEDSEKETDDFFTRELFAQLMTRENIFG